MVFVALLLVLALQRFDWKGIVGVLSAGVIFAGLAWTSSSYLRERVLSVAREIHYYRSADAVTSSGLRLEFWRRSVQFIADAPVFGHGTGTVKGLFRKSASAGGGASSVVTDQPHNQTLMVAIQLGLVGSALLFGIWISHLLLFRGKGLAAWIGFGVVVQNIISCLFNSYLFGFTSGWIYVFGVGVFGGMVFRDRSVNSPSTTAPSNTGR